jgi:hypothetical protein
MQGGLEGSAGLKRHETPMFWRLSPISMSSPSAILLFLIMNTEISSETSEIYLVWHKEYESTTSAVKCFILNLWAGVAQSVQCLTTDWTINPLQGQRIFLIAYAPRPALRPTQPPIQWALGVLSFGIKWGRGVTLTTNRHPVLRSKVSRSYTSSPPRTSMASSGTALLYKAMFN